MMTGVLIYIVDVLVGSNGLPIGITKCKLPNSFLFLIVIKQALSMSGNPDITRIIHHQMIDTLFPESIRLELNKEILCFITMTNPLVVPTHRQPSPSSSNPRI